VIIILDEIDLMNDDSVLMKLSRAEEAGKIDCSVGVIAISNKIQYVDNVNERVKSSFQHKGAVLQAVRRQPAPGDHVQPRGRLPGRRPFRGRNSALGGLRPRRNTAMLERRSTFFATPGRSPTRPEQSK